MNIIVCVYESTPNNILQQVFNALCTMFRPNVAEVHVPDRQCYMVLYHMEHTVLDLDSTQSSFFLEHIFKISRTANSTFNAEEVLLRVTLTVLSRTKLLSILTTKK